MSVALSISEVIFLFKYRFWQSFHCLHCHICCYFQKDRHLTCRWCSTGSRNSLYYIYYYQGCRPSLTKQQVLPVSVTHLVSGFSSLSRGPRGSRQTLFKKDIRYMMSIHTDPSLSTSSYWKNQSFWYSRFDFSVSQTCVFWWFDEK